MAGHVFIVRSDIRQLDCDAWLLSCDYKAQPGQGKVPPHLRSFKDWPKPPTDWKKGRQRVLEVTDWPSDEPRAWLVNAGAHSGQAVDWFVQGLQQALDRILPSLAEEKVGRWGRQKPLLATPLLGTNRGGLFARAGEAVQHMLPPLYAAVQKWDVDVALVVVGSEQHAAAQQVRRGHGKDAWPELNKPLRDRADALARLANAGKLALFLGSGVGTGVGLPRWDEFLHKLAKKAGITDEQFEQVRGLDVLDCASFIQRQLGSAKEMRQAILSIIKDNRNHFSLTHALLAGLPVVEAVTTNYDRLFEKAWDAAAVEKKPKEKSGEPDHFYDPIRTAVIPHTPHPDHDRWLLKLHGCVSRPKSIILTRESYIRYSHQWAALEGILQAALITRHMLFVGFSLPDPNFIRIVDAVRRIIPPEDARPAVHGHGPRPARPARARRRLEGARPAVRGRQFGTALMMLESQIMAKLWADDLRWIGLSGKEQSQMQSDDWARAARLLEVFLDYLLSRTDTGAHLLDDNFQAVLSEEDLQLKEKMHEFEKLYRRLPAEKRSPAWSRVEELLAALGSVHFRAHGTEPDPNTAAGKP